MTRLRPVSNFAQSGLDLSKGIGFCASSCGVNTFIDSPAAEYTTAHVALLTRMVSRPKNLLEHVSPILHWLIIHSHNDMFNDRWSDAFVGQRETNGPVAPIEFEDGPDRSAHLLASHVSGVTGNTQSTESDKRRDDCVISTGPARRLLLRHGADPIAGRLSVYTNREEIQ